MLACDRAGEHARAKPKTATAHIIFLFTIATLFLGF
jgi:hypothetical protein